MGRVAERPGISCFPVCGQFLLVNCGRRAVGCACLLVNRGPQSLAPKGGRDFFIECKARVYAAGTVAVNPLSQDFTSDESSKPASSA